MMLQKSNISESSLDRLRTLRQRAAKLNARVVGDLRPFLHRLDHMTFRRIPSVESLEGKVNVTTTCTALMSLTVTRHTSAFYGDRASKRSALDAFRIVVEHAQWVSARLGADNAFTTAMVIRGAGILGTEAGISKEELLELRHVNRPLRDVIRNLAVGVPESLRVQEYPPTPTIGYWFVDGLDRVEAEVPSETWIKLAEWGAQEFSRQMALLTSRHDAMMDPVAMIMSACLGTRLRRVAASKDSEWAQQVSRILPSFIEFREGVRKLFAEQAASGIWPKYFPLFHYPDLGANYTFTFEFLEALLHEFRGDQVLEEPAILKGLEDAVNWCEGNRLEYRYQSETYFGWNSGGHLPTLSEGLPEAWATGAVHMFLAALNDVLSESIQRLVLERYAPGVPGSLVVNRERWESVIDSPITVAGRRTSVRGILEEYVLNPLGAVKNRHDRLPPHRSALLFGPPGTSKTTLVRGLAEAVAWPFVGINPSHFLSLGLDGIYVRANEIFADLMDLSEVVVLFDEMDALVARRRGDGQQALDLRREFLTTSMLPKLGELHDKARAVFFMATNHQGALDEAIKRPGRFDLHVFVGPLPWTAKRQALGAFLPEGMSAKEVERLGTLLDGWLVGHNREVELLDRFSYGELRAFLNEMVRQGLPDDTGADAENFRNNVGYWGERLIILRNLEDPDSSTSPRNYVLEEYERDRSLSRVQ